MPELAVPALRAIREAGRWVLTAMVLSAVGVAAHTTAVVTRGLAVHRAPWGNMYEFVTALTCVAAIFFLYVMIRYRAWPLGVFVMGAVVVTLGLAETLIYTAAGDLVPALQSYWLDIHVTAMTLATGIFFVAAVLGFVYLWLDRYARRVAAGRAAPDNGIIRRLPSIEQIDRLTYRTVVFGFPVWTFGVIAGAIWADQAWGRYWGWDPVETWAFITWVLYAAYLHARATAGWRGRRAHYIQLLGFVSLTFNILVVQVFIAGLHSYAGVSLAGVSLRQGELNKRSALPSYVLRYVLRSLRRPANCRGSRGRARAGTPGRRPGPWAWPGRCGPSWLVRRDDVLPRRPRPSIARFESVRHESLIRPDPTHGIGSSSADELRTGCLTMSHAIAPPMNVTAMMTIHAGLGTPRHSEAGVNMASVRQYSQKPVMKRANSAPDSNMAEA